MKGLGLWIVLIVVFVAGFGCYNYVTTNNTANNQVEVPSTGHVTSDGTHAGQKSSPNNVNNGTNTNSNTQSPNQQNNNSDELNVSDINKSLIGQTVTIKCLVKNVAQPKETVFFDVVDPSSGAKLKGVLFNKTNTDNSGRKELLEDSMNSNRLIYITGEIDEYKGNLEIKAWRVFSK